MRSVRCRSTFFELGWPKVMPLAPVTVTTAPFASLKQIFYDSDSLIRFSD